HDFEVNTGPGVTPSRDIVLVYLANELGATSTQLPYVTNPASDVESWVAARLTENNGVNQYGRGYSTLATGVFGGNPPALDGGASGPYRTAIFAASNITLTHYTLAMNAATQIGAAGDSGGPTVVSAPDGRVFITGVQSTCAATGYVPGAPTATWEWATGISS